VSAGRLTAITDTECVPVADRRAIVVRVGDEVRAYRNRCVHQDSPLEGAWVRRGVLTCPLHFWRYRVEDGSLLGSDRKLEPLPVDVVDGEVFVLLPDEGPTTSLREQLLARARGYDRDEAWRTETGDTDDR
jgi:nitrite reductase/ring-hydroxylating ferredoxin subunit